MTHVSILLIAITALTLTACKKNEEGAGAAGKSVKATGPTSLPKLGLQIDVPGAVDVGDAIVGEGHMLTGTGIGAMTIAPAKSAQSIDEAKEGAGMYSPKKLVTEALADGWLMTFENKGAMGTNHWVEVRREIDGKHYKCTTTGHDAAQAANVAAACKSLRK